MNHRKFITNLKKIKTMKKLFTFLMLPMLCTLTANAQSFNLFPAEDVDADGWLWFNTQEKIDKYVGVCDEDNYTVDPNGKIVQLAFANITPTYPETVADPEAYGTDTQGYLATDEGVNTEELIKGSIILASAAAQMSMNGGCLILKLPSCSTISLYLSSEARMLGRTLMLTPGYDLSTDDSTGENPWTGHTKSIFAKASVFGSIHAAGHYKWETVATDNNGYNTGITFQSDEPVYFALQNCNQYPIFIHGIRITTPKQESASIKELTTDGKDAIEMLYNIDGKYVGKKPGVQRQKGVYIVKKGDKIRKIVIK